MKKSFTVNTTYIHHPRLPQGEDQYAGDLTQ